MRGRFDTVTHPKNDPRQFQALIREDDSSSSLFFYDMSINEHPRRSDLSKNSFLDFIGRLSGASIVVRGATSPKSDEKPLYLHVSGRNQKSVANAIAFIYDVIEGLIDLPEDQKSTTTIKTDSSTDVSVNIINPPASFNLRAKILGREGAYVKHITATTGCRVQLKGLGSQYLDPTTGKEEPVPLYMHITGPSEAQVDEARELAEGLAGTVRKDYERFRSNQPNQSSLEYSEFLSWAKANPDNASTYVQQMRNLYKSLHQNPLLQQQPVVEAEPMIEEVEMDIEEVDMDIEEVEMDEQDVEVIEDESIQIHSGEPESKRTRVE
ncbi:hypothetical protein RCL1_007595 [Eukaryota sp. TZLM3-RCL]